jgi:RnfABCDGE-type electron transport complex G subunit
MRDALRMALTLLIIGAICGGLLSVVNGITAPMIADRENQQFLQALEGFFPDVVKFEVQEINGEEFYSCYDAAGKFIGVVGKVKASGYGGEISYDLAVSDAGDIIGIRISSHGETPGIGDVITKPAFQDRVIGLNFADPISAGVDVDTVSGATVSSSGMINSIRRVMNVVGENFLGMEVEKAAIDLTKIADGTYTGTARGFKSDVTVEVVVSGGKITSLEIVSHDDTPGISDNAVKGMPQRIIDAQSLEVDVVSGASMTSQGIINAVFNALK